MRRTGLLKRQFDLSLPQPDSGSLHWPADRPKAQRHLARQPRRWRRRRRGQTLVYFSLFWFGFMALAALVIDIGFARLAQRQLQSAADSAALEGLRGAGTLDYAQRQAAAGNFVAWQFDDDLNTSMDDGAFDSGSGQFGAGPLVEFSGGAGAPELAASQRIDIDPGQPVYKPVALAGASAHPDQFRVALQRGVADAPAADLYSLGPAVPFLFARGSLTDRESIQRGITVRGTGVARGSRALSVGLAQDAATPALPGLIPLALDLSYWNSLTSGLADSQPLVAGEVGLVGRFFNLCPIDMLPVAIDTLPVAIGRTLPVASQPLEGNYTGYVPIYAAIPLGASTTERVVGFGQVSAEVTAGAPPQVDIVRQPESVAVGNAAGVVCYRVELTADEMDAVLALNRTIADPLLAPVSGSGFP